MGLLQRVKDYYNTGTMTPEGKFQGGVQAPRERQVRRMNAMMPMENWEELKERAQRRGMTETDYLALCASTGFACLALIEERNLFTRLKDGTVVLVTEE